MSVRTHSVRERMPNTGTWPEWECRGCGQRWPARPVMDPEALERQPCGTREGA